MIKRLVFVLIALLIAPTMAFSQLQKDIHWSDPQTLRIPGKPAVTAYVVRFAGDVTSEKVVAEMRKQQRRPTRVDECSALAELMGDGLYGCLGTVTRSEDGDKFVLILLWRRGIRQGEFVQWDGFWMPPFQFPAIQEKRP